LRSKNRGGGNVATRGQRRGTNDERARPSVNAGNCGDDGQATGEGNASKGGTPSGKARAELSVTTIFGSLGQGAEQRAGNVANPMAGCRVQQTCTVPRASLLARRSAAEETVGAGRNGKGGTCRGLGRPGPKNGPRLVREWTQWHRAGEGESMNPKRGVPTGSDREATPGRDGTNWRVSPKRRDQDSFPRGMHGAVGQGPTNPPPQCTGRTSWLRSRADPDDFRIQPPGGRLTLQRDGRPVRSANL